MARENGGSGLSFIVGALVVAVAIIAVVVWAGDWGGGGGDATDVGISTQTGVPGAVPEAPAGNDVNVEVETAPAAPAAGAQGEAAPAAPAQQ